MSICRAQLRETSDALTLRMSSDPAEIISSQHLDFQVIIQ